MNKISRKPVIKIRKPTAPGTILFKNKKRAAKADPGKRKAKHKKRETST